MRTISLLLILACVAGCNPQDTTELRQDATKLGQTASRAAGNATVAGKANLALSLRKGVNMSGLHIEATGGTVTVSGHVSSPDEKKVVLDTVTNTRGVDKVVDHLKVAEAKK